MTLAIGHGIGMPFGGRSWVPTDLGGCKLWLPASMGLSCLPDIARWLDRSGQLNDVEQTAAADKPSLSGEALRFDYSNTEFLSRDVIASIDNGYTIGIALRFRSLLGAYQCAMHNGDPNNDGQRLFLRNTNKRAVYHDASYVEWGDGTTNPETWVVRHDGAGASADFCLNGSHQTPQSLVNNVTPTTYLRIGGQASVFPADVDVWAVIAYPTRLSDADTLLLSTYLTNLRNGTPSGSPPGTPVLWLERPDRYACQAISDHENQGSLAKFAQSDVTKQPVLLPYGLGGRPSIHYDDTDDSLIYSGAAGDFNFLHDGTGGTYFVIFYATANDGNIIDQLRGSAAREGFALRHIPDNLKVYVGNGSGTMLVDDNATWSPANTPGIAIVRLQTGASPEYDLRINGTSLASGSFTGSASSGDPNWGTRIGEYELGGSNFGGELPEHGAYDRYITDAECQQLEAYAMGGYGL